MDKSQSVQMQFCINNELLNVDVPIDLVPRIFEDEQFKLEFINSILQSQSDPFASEVVFKWQDNAVKLLLENCRLEIENFRNPKIKKNIWIKISKKKNDLRHNVTPDMCDKKYRNLKMTYRAVKDKTKFPMDEMDEILCTDATLNPLFLMSSLKPSTLVSNSPTIRSLQDDPQPSTSGYNPIDAVSRLAEADTPPQNIQPQVKQQGKKKNRDLQGYRKKMIGNH